MIGETISHYKVVEKLGQGGMGVVYKAQDLTLDRLVALKFLAPHLASDDDSHKRFIREAKSAATLDHPNICTVYEIGEAEGRTFISMAYVEGQSLEQLIDQGPFGIDDALELVLQVAGALAAAHDKGIIHRDIKPANILVAERSSGKDRQAKLVDFGLAQFASSSKITKLGSTIGTVAYMSPEQTSGKDVDHRTDIWALGVVLYQLVTGQLPFKGHYEAAIVYSIMNEAPELLTSVSSGVSPELERIVNTALAKDPDERYERMEDLIADLRALQRGGQRQAYGSGEVTGLAWAKVKNIFLEVCDLEPEIRRQRLEDLCGDNQELRQEVERWLRQDSPDSILDSACPSAGRAVGEDESSRWNAPAQGPDPWIGRTIQSYKLLALIGSGGMGIVYRAEDTRLKRPVAVKFLSPRFLRDDRQKKRFLREAQAAAGLDHPSICSVYDVGEIEGHPFIVTAYIAGENLAAAIPPGGLSEDTALDCAIQIAEGLHAAHQLGIIHRDMKPGNVILASSAQGIPRAKIIDFGLSRISGASQLSEPGQLLGTAAYMAPEILQGKAVDQRGDIWSLGVMLYEMLCGRPPFDAENRERLFYMICHEEAEPLTALCPQLTDDTGKVVAKALEKDRERRYKTVRDFLDDLQDLKRQVSPRGIALSALERASATAAAPPAAKISAASAPTTDRSKTTRRWIALGAAGVLVIVVALVGLVLALKEKDTVRRPAELKRLTFDSALAIHPAVSPDGRYLAFASDRAGEGNLDIWVQSLPEGEPVRLTNDPANDDFPFFSPDSTKVAFQSERDGRGIYSVPILGGEPRLLAQNGNQPRYSPDGRRLSFTFPDPGSSQQTVTAAVFTMPAESGEPTEMQTDFLFTSNPVWSPDANRLLYAGFTKDQSDPGIQFQVDGRAFDGSGWYISPASGGQPVRIETSNPFARFVPTFPIPLAWLAGNRVLFSHASGEAINLWAAKLSADTRRIIGPPEQLTFGMNQIADASAAGADVVFAITNARLRLWEIPLGKGSNEGKDDRIGVATDRAFTYWPSLSDTGKLAYFSQTSGKLNLWLRDLPSGKETLLSSMEGNFTVVSACINPSGTEVAYTGLRDSKQVIYKIGVTGGTPEKICEDCGQLRAWSPERKLMLSGDDVFDGPITAASRIHRIDMASGQKTVLIENRQFVYAPDLSPDGKWVAFQARTNLADRKEQLFVAPMSDDGPLDPDRLIPITDLKFFDANPKFSRDGNIIYFNSDRDGFTCLWAVRLDAATKKPTADPFAVEHFHGSPRHYSWYPVFTVGLDRIVISLEQIQSDLWMTKLPE